MRWAVASCRSMQTIQITSYRSFYQTIPDQWPNIEYWKCARDLTAERWKCIVVVNLFHDAVLSSFSIYSSIIRWNRTKQCSFGSWGSRRSVICVNVIFYFNCVASTESHYIYCIFILIFTEFSTFFITSFWVCKVKPSLCYSGKVLRLNSIVIIAKTIP